LFIYSYHYHDLYYLLGKPVLFTATNFNCQLKHLITNSKRNTLAQTGTSHFGGHNSSHLIQCGK